MMRRTLAVGVILSTFASPNSVADEIGVAGLWNVLITNTGGTCEWQGQVTLRQSGTQIEGDGWAEATSGGAGCPQHLEGNVAGYLDGRLIRFGFGLGELGEADFRGLVLKTDRDMRGDWGSGSSGGDWVASVAQQ